MDGRKNESFNKTEARFDIRFHFYPSLIHFAGGDAVPSAISSELKASTSFLDHSMTRRSNRAAKHKQLLVFIATY